MSGFSAVELLTEVLTNVHDQVLVLEIEMISNSVAPEVKDIYEQLREILLRVENGKTALRALESNPVATSRLESSSETVKKLRKLEEAMTELEKEVFHYFIAFIAVLLKAFRM